ncbi:MAG: ABC transporter ATP-binding protein [Nitrospirae bacterium]|nr:ABC transporter ATP-binding protein [Nitrospirota bacterium]
MPSSFVDMKQIAGLLKFFYDLVGNRLFLLFSLMICATGFQGLSVGLFLPILQGENGDSRISRAIKGILGLMGLEYTLLSLLILLVGFFTLRSIFLVGQSALVGKIMSDLLVGLRCRIAEKIFGLDYQAFLKKSSGYLNNAIIVEFHNVVFSFKMFSSLLVTILFAIMYVSIPLFLKPVLILVLAGVGFPLFLVIKKINIMTKDNSVRLSAHSARLQKILIQSLNYFKYLKATSEYQKVLRQIVSQSRKLGRIQFRQQLLGAITEDGFEPVVVMILAGVIFYYVGFKGQDIIEHIFLLFLLLNAMKMMLSVQTNLRKLLNTWGSIEVLKTLEAELEGSKEKSPEAGAAYDAPFDKPIRFENVGFSFSSGAQILRNVNMEIPPNSTVAFVGESGAGKTTIINMLTGLLRPTTGAIYAGDTPYGDIDMRRMRKQIGYITQENVIFNDTIYNNVTMWESKGAGRDMEGVEAVAGKAHMAEFIRGLENGYDSVLGEGGINISGGQRQRICIARELYKDAKVLIFDEATSALDTKTEKEIQKNIEEFKGQKTIIIVAHRLSTVRNSDRIFVLKDGAVVEEGSYEDLCNLNEEFKSMIVQQNS